jgi:hypothetical protein
VPSPDKVGLFVIPYEIEIVSITWCMQVKCLFLSASATVKFETKITCYLITITSKIEILRVV